MVEVINSLRDNKDNGATVYYDGACLFCRTGVHLLRRCLFLRGTRLTPGEQAPHINDEIRKSNTWVVEDQFGQTCTEFDALTFLFRQSPVFWPLFYFLRMPPVPHLGRILYRFVATHRRGPRSRAAWK